MVRDMSSYPESQLRDLLADNLALIEPGLRLIKPEFWLKNADGVKGSIDLLAQDRHGMYVVIELKVSEPSGRKTVAQVMKYVRLLEDNGKSRREIRAIIVSTWREMLTTISEFARTQDYDVRGYRVHVDEAGDLTVERVQLLAEAFEQRLTPIHFQYLYCCAEDREIGWENVVQCVREVGAKHLVGVDHDFIGSEEVVSPYSLYVAFGTVEPGDLADAPGGPLEEDYQENPIYERHRREYRALCRMTSTVFVPRPCTFNPGNRFWGTTESASPEKFARLERDPLWAVRQVRGTGAYEPGGLWTERDIRTAGGREGRAGTARDDVGQHEGREQME